MQVQEGDEQLKVRYDEEWAPGPPGCLPSLLNKDVPDWQNYIARLLPETPANIYWMERRGDKRSSSKSAFILVG